MWRVPEIRGGQLSEKNSPGAGHDDLPTVRERSIPPERWCNIGATYFESARSRPFIAMSPPQNSNESFHNQRLKRRLKDPDFKAEYERQLRAIQAVDDLVNDLDRIRESLGLSKAEVARMIDKNPASVRRLLTASGNPELKTVVALADALDADVKIIPRRQAKHKRVSARSRRPKSATT